MDEKNILRIELDDTLLGWLKNKSLIEGLSLEELVKRACSLQQDIDYFYHKKSDKYVLILAPKDENDQTSPWFQLDIRNTMLENSIRMVDSGLIDTVKKYINSRIICNKSALMRKFNMNEEELDSLLYKLEENGDVSSTDKTVSNKRAINLLEPMVFAMMQTIIVTIILRLFPSELNSPYNLASFILFIILALMAYLRKI